MSKCFQIIGILILAFIIISNHIDISLSNSAVIILAVLGAVLMCIGIFISDKKQR